VYTGVVGVPPRRDVTLHSSFSLSPPSQSNNNNTNRPTTNVWGKPKNTTTSGFCQKVGWQANCIFTCFAALCTRTRRGSALNTSSSKSGEMVWTYGSVLNDCVQLLILVAVLEKARVLTIRALRALDSTSGAASAASRVAARPELWGIIAGHSGVVGAWRLTGVCVAARAGGHTTTSTSSVEMLSEETGQFVNLPPLSCGAIEGSVAIVVEEKYSVAGQVLLIGVYMSGSGAQSAMYLVDLATGACAPQPAQLNNARRHHAAARQPDTGRIVCAGGLGGQSPTDSAVVYGPPVQGAPNPAWTWTDLPPMSVGRYACRGCVMSDSRFAVLGGAGVNYFPTSSCEALVISEEGAQWEPMSPMHDPRSNFACGAVAGCIIVAGGRGLKSVEVYAEVLDQWFRLPCDLPYDTALCYMGSALL
jgi:hypothetical protein